MQLGITTIQRDRAPWIEEWVAFHYLVGFRKFYIFTHLCSDNTEKILDRLKKHFDIKIIPINELNDPQPKYHQYSCDNFLKEVDWMAFIDGDEFLFPTAQNSIEAVLKEFNDKKLSALGVYWACFGSSGYIEEPPGFIVENYKYRAEDKYHNNRHIKSIIKGRHAAAFVKVGRDAHLFKTPFGTYDENLRPVTCGWTDHEPSYKKIRINHYITQSRSFFFNFKKKAKLDIFKDDIDWEEHNKNDILDNSMDSYIGPLKDILNSI